jgi:hypothetical protein
LKRRLQVSGYRLQWCGNEAGVVLADRKSYVEASPASSASADANGLEDLMPDA